MSDEKVDKPRLPMTREQFRTATLALEAHRASVALLREQMRGLEEACGAVLLALKDIGYANSEVFARLIHFP